MKIEQTRIHFLSDVFAADAVLVRIIDFTLLVVSPI